MKALLPFAAAIALSASSGHVVAAGRPGAPAMAQVDKGPLVPRPFPGSTPTRPSGPPPATPPPAPPPATTTVEAPAAPTDATTAAAAAQALQGVPLYPSAELIEGFDAGNGQTYYLYGTNAPYVTIVAFYKETLKNGGRELYRSPAMQQFDLGRFDQDSMSYPPSVVVKDYAWNGSEGYLAVSGTTPKRYHTIIQIVPPPSPAR
jgi:hypothetical protein